MSIIPKPGGHGVTLASICNFTLCVSVMEKHNGFKVSVVIVPAVLRTRGSIAIQKHWTKGYHINFMCYAQRVLVPLA